jgi:glutamate--cysteine ligase
MVRESLHKNFCNESSKIANWFCEKTKELSYPVYSSYDIRDSGFKITNVDANINPAGFNNICNTDKESAVDLFSKYLVKHYGAQTDRILLVTEEHTNNPFYWENVMTIKTLLEGSGRKVLISIPRKFDQPLQAQTTQGASVEIVSAYESSEAVQSFKPQLILSNNDFSESYEDWATQITLPVNPPRELGWYQRKKNRYFKHYNNLVNEFAAIAGIDPFLMNVRTEVYEHFDMADEGSRNSLAEHVDRMIDELAQDYSKRGLKQKPFVFVKNNSGTYGLAVLRVGSGSEVKDWNYKSRKKMKAAKGGRDVEEFIIQEGIPTRVQTEGATAEPVIYMVGCELAGGFLRTHGEKSNEESLNSPGAVYKRLCVSDLNVSLDNSPLENVYGWSARLGLLAIAMEAQEMKVQFKGWQTAECSAKV